VSIIVFCVSVAFGQQTSAKTAESPEVLENRVQQLESEVSELKQIVRQLQQGTAAQAKASASGPGIVEVSAPVASQAVPAQSASVVSADDRKTLDFLGNTTINVGIDTYYGYNFNNPVGRVNLLRAYDVPVGSNRSTRADRCTQRSSPPPHRLPNLPTELCGYSCRALLAVPHRKLVPTHPRANWVSTRS